MWAGRAGKEDTDVRALIFVRDGVHGCLATGRAIAGDGLVDVLRCKAMWTVIATSALGRRHDESAVEAGEFVVDGFERHQLARDKKRQCTEEKIGVKEKCSPETSFLQDRLLELVNLLPFDKIQKSVDFYLEFVILCGSRSIA